MPIAPVAAALEILSRDSRPRRNAANAISYVMDLLYYGEFSIFEQVSSLGGAELVNVVGSKGRGESPLWLVSYAGTGDEPSPSEWRSTGGKPLAPRVDGGLLYGLGACSGKVDLAMKILAASRFRRDELERPIKVLALFGEEGRATGIRSLLGGVHGTPAAALVSAPTNLELWLEQPGCVVFELRIERRIRHRRMPPIRGIFELEVRGASNHAQLAERGDDALSAGLDLLGELREPGDLRVLAFDAGSAANRTPGRCAITVATAYDEMPELPANVSIRPVDDGAAVPFPVDNLLEAWLTAREAGIEAAIARTAPDQRAGVCRPRVAVHTGWLVTGRDEIAGSVAFWTGDDVDTVEVAEAFADAAQGALVGTEELSIDLHVTQDRRPLRAPSGERPPFVKDAVASLRSIGIPPVISGGTITSDAGVLADAGASVLVFGPGWGQGHLYRDDEAVPVAHLEAAFAFYQQMIERWCVGIAGDG